MTLLALVVAVTAGAQGTTIYEYPWNPDWDNDNFVGSSDLTGFLSAFGSEFGNPPEPCDYDGTDLEAFVGQIFSGELVIDSIFIEYEVQDISSYFVAGCPEEQTDTLVFAESIMLSEGSFNLAGGWGYECDGVSDYGGYTTNKIFFDGSSGHYTWKISAGSLGSLGFTSDGFFGSSSAETGDVSIPFPSEWYLDEYGIHIESGWDENDWPYYANYLHILPYWHYVE